MGFVCFPILVCLIPLSCSPLGSPPNKIPAESVSRTTNIIAVGNSAVPFLGMCQGSPKPGPTSMPWESGWTENVSVAFLGTRQSWAEGGGAPRANRGVLEPCGAALERATNTVGAVSAPSGGHPGLDNRSLLGDWRKDTGTGRPYILTPSLGRLLCPGAHLVRHHPKLEFWPADLMSWHPCLTICRTLSSSDKYRPHSALRCYYLKTGLASWWVSNQ